MANILLINDLIRMEWNMFSSVNEGGPKADCQQDPITFEGMRKAQFISWDNDTLESYYNDVKNAEIIGRNLIMEKYIHMMQYTQPEQYSQLLTRVVYPSDEAIAIAEKITYEMIKQTAPLHKKYPYVSGSGRPLYATEDYKGFISVETYQKGELYTYSFNTLSCLWKHINDLKLTGVSLAKIILENSVKHYGYSSLEQAEASISAHYKRI